MKFVYLLILVIFCACNKSSSYDWSLRTIEHHDTDFTNNLRKEKNLLQLSDKTTNVNEDDDDNFNDDKSFYKKFNNNKYVWKSDDVNFDKNYVFDKETVVYPYNENLYTKKDNQNEKYKTNLILLQNNKDINRKQNINNDEQYTGANSYNNNEQRDKNEQKFNSKNYYYKEEPKLNKNNHNIPAYEQKDANKDLYDDNNSNHFHKVNMNNNKNNNNSSDDENNKKENLVIISQCSGKYDDIENFVGTNLLDDTVKRCFSTEEVVLLATRRDFENLIPKDLPQCLFTDGMVQVLLNYFYICHRIIIKEISDSLISLTLKAFYDTLGGYLNYYMVPVAKYSYYAGQISLDTAQKVIILHQQCKAILNTNGNAWKAPIQNVLVELNSVQIEPLNIPSINEDKLNEPSCCTHLDMSTEGYQPNDEKMIVQIPKLETVDYNGYLGNVWLPFKRKKIYDLKADSSAYVIVKFYEAITKCYRSENADQSFYNNEFKSWLLENIHIHLSDEQFYPGLGAVLRIYEYLKRYKKDAATFKGNKILHQINSNPHNNNYDNLKTLDNNEKILIDFDLFNANLTNHNLNNLIQKNSTDVSRKNNIILKGAGNQPPIDGTQQMAANNIDSINTKVKLRNFELTPAIIAVIAIPVVVLLIIIICCYRTFCKKKKPDLKKHSSSSSSNLLQSPVRFFHLRPKSVSDYSSNDTGGKKTKKTVKIKKSAMNSDTSASSSPVRNKSKGKLKDSSKK